jgi:hypothetical protein
MELKNCPFCGMGDIYELREVDNERSEFPALFCNSCKAIVYFEDNTSRGENEDDDYQMQQSTLHERWNTRQPRFSKEEKDALTRLWHIVSEVSEYEPDINAMKTVKAMMEEEK